MIAHRGEHLSHPENTLAAFQSAIDSGADFFELDVRTTADGKLVLMHDSSVDRMTNGTGEIRAMSFEAVRKLDVGIKLGQQWAGTRVPTFDEALALARGRIGVYVDSKSVSARDAVDALTRNGMVEHAVVYGGARYLGEVAALEPRLKVMPEADNPANLRSLADALKLRVAAFDAKDFTDPVIGVARAAGIDIYVDRLWDADNPRAWQDAVDRGAAGIQTDHPAELVDYLRAHGYR